jgi:hypothetical protein
MDSGCVPRTRSSAPAHGSEDTATGRVEGQTRAGLRLHAAVEVLDLVTVRRNQRAARPLRWSLPGAFYSLPRARRGERIHIATADGAVHTYRVVTVDSYPKTALPLTMFDPRGPRRLVLVTCGGRFDSTTMHFLDNIVVTAVPV